MQITILSKRQITAQPLADVASLIHSWEVDFIVTTGDNNYDAGSADTIDANIGQYFSDYIYPYQGSYGSGAAENRFFPSPGNHDWQTEDLQPYLDYFTLPGNERYYDFTAESVHIFVIDSDPQEPDGRTADSIQANWLQAKLSTSPYHWKLVFMHHPPYSSSTVHGSETVMQWPYADWGVTAVLGGHDHTYERIQRDGMLYFVNGLGGRSIYGLSEMPVSGSQFRYNEDYGAMLVTVNPTCLAFSFYNRSGSLVDSHTVELPPRAFIPLVTK
jgi:tartrate-resistant acid phosphatase type 5